MPYAQLVTPKDVCQPVKNLVDINWNKCIRSFMYRWCQVVMEKIIIMIFMPFFVIIFKTLRQKLSLRFCCIKWFKKKYGERGNRTVIDMEYCMIINKLELVITFSLITPLIVPLTLIAIESNRFFYDYMIYKLNWRLCYYHSVLSFPIQFLIFGVIFEQSLIMSFCYFCIQNSLLCIILGVALMIIDITLFTLYLKKRKRHKRIKSIMDETEDDVPASLLLAGDSMVNG